MKSLIFPAALALLLTSCIATPFPGPHETITRNLIYAHPSRTDLTLDLYIPKAARPVPVIIWFHGGGWKYGDKGLLIHIRNLTRKGFAVASVQYRRSWEAPWPAQRDDAAAAIQWVRDHGSEYGLDGHRLGLAGDSAGGHLACLLGLEIGEPRIRAVCAMYPPTDMIALAERYRDSERYNLISQLFGGSLRERRKLMFDASPVNHVSRHAPPFYFLHGQRDPVVPISQSRDLDSRLRAAGIDSRLDEFPAKAHGFRLDEVMLDHVTQFFRRHL